MTKGHSSVDIQKQIQAYCHKTYVFWPDLICRPWMTINIVLEVLTGRDEGQIKRSIAHVTGELQKLSTLHIQIITRSKTLVVRLINLCHVSSL